jgi:hypothetical protein
MYYKKIEIKSEADLPVKMGDYFVHEKNRPEWDLNSYFYASDHTPIWLNNIAWYLQPVEEELYPKEFVEWLSSNSNGVSTIQFTDPPLFTRFEIGSNNKYTLDELFEYWTNNVKNK